MAKKILLALALVLGLLVVIIAMQPAAFTIVRTATINAPPQLVFAQVNDFHRWLAWSPWEKTLTDVKQSYSGDDFGVGAKYAWASKESDGNMTIEESKPERISIALNFTQPFKAENRTLFDFKPEGTGTAVTWSMTGTRDFMSKAAGLVMDMDKLVGGDFENGLAAMKTIAEAEATSSAAAAVAAQASEAKAGAEAAAAAAAAVTDAGTP